MTASQMALALNPLDGLPASGVEAAWIEPESARGRLARANGQAFGIEAVFGRTFGGAWPNDQEWRDLLHPDDASRVIDAYAQRDADGGFDAVYRLVMPDGESRRVRDRLHLLRDRSRLRIVSVLGEARAAEPVARRIEAPAEPRDMDLTGTEVLGHAGPIARAGAPTAGAPSWLATALGECVVRCDHVGRVIEAFGPGDCLPAPVDALIGHRLSELGTLPPAMIEAWSTALERTIDTRRAQICGYEIVDDGATRAFEARMLPLDGGQVVAVIRDVTERNRLRGRVEFIALHDLLTGLGNGRAMRERLAAWITSGRRADGQDEQRTVPVCLMLVDLDRFKQTNDAHGQSIGDTLLRLIAQRLRREVHSELRGRPHHADEARVESPPAAAAGEENLLIARIGGDQFAVAWRLVDAGAPPGADVAARCAAMATRLLGALGSPTRLAGQTLFARASIGMALYPDDARDAPTLLSQADAALMRAKKAGRNQYRRHGDDAPRTRDTGPPNDEAAMRAALAAGEFSLVYLPKFELASSLVADAVSSSGERGALVPGAVLSVEALVRWRVPGGELLIPHQFIPLAESSGMIRPLGDWVMRTALAEVAGFAAQGGARVGVAINVSLLQLHDRSFVQSVEATLREHGFAPGELTIELAETAFVEDIRLVADALAELSALGVRLAIDHFGAGTAGLVALKSLPVDEIKIDRSFVAGASIDAFDATIVAGLIDMAHNLGISVTADGVERIDQIASLSQMRCDAIQGYFIGDPMSASELVAMSRLWRNTRS